jgi:polysaccharide chain length determinant protein (PEP-CTERM system associated)
LVRADALKPADIIGVLWRYRLALVVAVVLGAAVSYGYSLLIPNQFTATTLVLVEEDTLDSSYVRSAVTVDLEARLRTLREQVLSRTRLQDVMDRFGLFNDQSSWEQRLSEMRDRISISVTRTDSFRISFTHTDPIVARDVTNSLAQLFIEDSRAAMARQSQGTASLIDDRMREVAADLAIKEDALARFKAEHRGSLPEEVSATVNSLDWSKTQLSTTRADLTAARNRLSRLQRLTALPTDAPGESPSARQLARSLLATSGSDLEDRLATQPTAIRLAARRLQRESLLKQLTPRHPDVRFLDMEIAALEAQLGTEDAYPADSTAGVVGSSDLLGQQLDDGRREISLLEQKRNELQTQISGFESRIAAAPSVEQELRDVERDYDALSTEYRDLRTRRMEANLAGTLEREQTGGFKVVDPAVAPERKSSPARAFFFLAGAVIAGALAAGSAFAYEMIVQPVHLVADLERFIGVPVLTRIPSIPSPARRRRRLATRALAIVVVAVAATSVFVLRLLT